MSNCRFGDVLSAADCARLLHELRQTRLWHCCAHGRPTIVPLVDTAVLQRVVASRRSAALYCMKEMIGGASLD
jgi:DNA mismatch repair ATPase MutL